MVYVDVGASTNIRPMFTQSGISSNATTNVGQLMVGKNSHETNINNCDDGKLTIMKGSANGRLKLANRLDDTYMFYLTMPCMYFLLNFFLLLNIMIRFYFQTYVR